MRPLLTSSPHLRAPGTVEGAMYSVMLALVPAAAAAVYLFGTSALGTMALSVLACLFFEGAALRLRGRSLSTLTDGSAALTGLLLAMNLPSSIPWWMVLVGSAVAVLLGKQLFGGLGCNPFNPALVARVFLLISYPVAMTSWPVPRGLPGAVDAVSAATPLGEMKTRLLLEGQLGELSSAGLMEPLLGTVGGSLGEVSALALLAGGVFLLLRGVITWHIPVSFLASTAAVTGFFRLLDPSRYASPSFHLVTGGLMLGAFFMATDYVTSPVTPRGMLIFGAGCGVITALIRLFGGYPEGVSFAILLMNGAVPLIDRYTAPRPFGHGVRLEGGRT